MNLFGLPPFRPVDKGELRRLWVERPDPDVRRLVLEVQRYRRLLHEISRMVDGVDKSWKAEGRGHLVGLHLLKVALIDERGRVPPD